MPSTATKKTAPKRPAKAWTTAQKAQWLRRTYTVPTLRQHNAARRKTAQKAYAVQKDAEQAAAQAAAQLAAEARYKAIRAAHAAAREANPPPTPEAQVRAKLAEVMAREGLTEADRAAAVARFRGLLDLMAASREKARRAAAQTG